MLNGTPVGSGGAGDILEGTGSTPGSGVGEAVELVFGGGPYIQLVDGRAYFIEVTAVARGLISASPNARCFKARYAVRRDGGVTTIADTGATDQFGDSGAASWTLIASVGITPDRFALTFNTGSTTSAVNVDAKVQLTEVA